MTEEMGFYPDKSNMDPCDTPRGMTYYDLGLLTGDQQERLNYFKRAKIREDEKYLAQHQEIRAIVSMIYKTILLKRPRADVHIHVAEIFARPKEILQKEIDEYVKSREGHVSEGDSAVNMLRKEKEERAEITRTKRAIKAFITQDILDVIFNKAVEILGSKMNVIDESTIYSISETTIQRSLFDIFDRISKSSHTGLKQRAMEDLLRQEIFDRLDFYVQLVVEIYSGLPMKRFKLYRGPPVSSGTPSDESLQFEEEEEMEEQLEEHTEIEEEAIPEIVEHEHEQDEEEAAAIEEQRAKEREEKRKEEEKEARAQAMMQRRAMLLAKQQEENPFGDLTAKRDEEKEKEPEKEEGEGETKQRKGAMFADLSKFAKKDEQKDKRTSESKGIPGFNPELMKMAGGKSREAPDDEPPAGRRRR